MSARRNAYDGLLTAQTGEGALSEVSNLLIRVRELAVQSTNGTLGNAERRSIGIEAEGLLQEVDRIVATTEFSDKSLIDGTFSVEIATGADPDDRLALPNVDASIIGLGLAGLDFGTDAETSAAAFEQLDSSIQQVAGAAAALARLRIPSNRELGRASS